MEELFGIPMNTIMFVLVALFAVAVASVVLVFVRSGHMFRMGLRNIPRRGMQSGLVIVGLMLATLITTAAFTTGDTIDYSIAKQGYERLQRTDLAVNLLGEKDLNNTDSDVYISDGVTSVLEQQFAGDKDMRSLHPCTAGAGRRSRPAQPPVRAFDYALRHRPGAHGAARAAFDSSTAARRTSPRWVPMTSS